jgi:glycosyltransferase involved in cell wall biosynthesis
MHVLMTVPEMGAGGAEEVVSALARNILAGGGEVTIASSGGWRANALEHDGARLVYAPFRGRRPHDLARAALTLRRQLAGPRVDVVHAHNVKSAGVSAIAARHRDAVPIVVTLHGVPQSRYGAAARILRRCADELVAVSDDVAGRVCAAGFPSARLRVIENAVATPQRHGRDHARARLGLALDAPVAVCVARLTAQKRHDVLVAAWRELPADAVLLLAGDGATRSRVEAAIRDTGQTDRVRLLGERRDVDWLLAAADVCVLPTDWEGLPISVLEAMAAGVPVVASAVGGVVQLGADAVELVDPGSSAALAAGLRRAFTDAARRASMIAAGAALMTDRFSPQRMWSDYGELYERVHRSASTAGRY